MDYKLTSRNFPSLNILNESTACAYEKYVITWNDKKGGKCGKFYMWEILQGNLTLSCIMHDLNAANIS